MVAVIVIGNLVLSPATPPALFADANVIEPLTIPVPFDTSLLSNPNPVNWVLSLSLTSISELPIFKNPLEPLKFCCWKLNSIDNGSEVLSLPLRNENTWEFKLPINNFAEVPSEPSEPCRAFVNDIVFVILALPLVAVISTEPLSCPNADIVNTFPFVPPNAEVTPVPFVLAYE